MSKNPRLTFGKGAAREYVESVYGGPIAEQDSTPSIGTAVSIVLAGNGDRVAVTFVNMGTNPVILALDPAPLATQGGIQLGGLGGAVSMNARDDGTLPSRAWYGICPGGPSNIFIMETFRVSLSESEGT